MAGYGLLVAFWGVFLMAFWAHMVPRLGYLTRNLPIGNDMPCKKPECDFSVFWPAGQLARAHDFVTLYSPHRFVAAVSAMLIPCPNIETFFYPPTMLLPVGAISLLPFEWGAFVWTFGMVVLAVLILRLARVHWLVILAGLLSPAALLNMEVGQLGVLGGALLVAGFTLAQRRPGLSGGLLGLLACKPQTGILVPIVYLAQRNWRALIAFTLMALALVALVTWVFGVAVWDAYFTLGHAETMRVLGAPFDPHTSQGWGVSIYWLARSFGASTGAASTGQFAVSLLAAAALYWLWQRRALFAESFVEAAVLLSLLATPYGYSADMVGYSLVLAEAARRRGWRINMLDTLLWLWPGFCLVVSISTGHELTPLIVMLALWRAWRVPLPGAEPVLPGAPIGA
jgi:hypothetical protein